jgi:hypothetical protein
VLHESCPRDQVDELGVRAGRKGSVDLGQALLDVDPVGITLIGLANGASIEERQRAEPRDEARRLAPAAKGRELELEFG